MSQFQQKTPVSRVEQLTGDVFRLTLDSHEIAGSAQPGQFVMLRTNEGKDPLLRRPFSISQTSNNKHFQILFKVVGRGTSLLSRCRVEETLSVLGPLGTGFTMESKRENYLLGGGMGIAPLLFLAKALLRKNRNNPPIVILGARSKDELVPLIHDFKTLGLSVHVATDDGTLGHHGLITDVLQVLAPSASARIAVCGPYPMMSAVYLYCKKHGQDCQVSMETAMACGMGACLGCIVPVAKGGYAHACSDGPVFDAKELLWKIK